MLLQKCLDPHSLTSFRLYPRLKWTSIENSLGKGCKSRLNPRLKLSQLVQVESTSTLLWNISLLSTQADSSRLNSNQANSRQGSPRRASFSRHRDLLVDATQALFFGHPPETNKNYFFSCFALLLRKTCCRILDLTSQIHFSFNVQVTSK